MQDEPKEEEIETKLEPEELEEIVQDKRSLKARFKDWSVPIAWGLTGTCLVTLIAGLYYAWETGNYTPARIAKYVGIVSMAYAILGTMYKNKDSE